MNDISSGSGRDPVDELLESFLGRLRRGERPSLEEYVARCPDRAAEIRELFPALIEMEWLKPAVAAGTDPRERPSARPDPTIRPPPPHPERLGDYHILRVIGEGGMGVVYEAEHESLSNRVALKVMHPRFRTGGSHLRRFRQEARSAARLHHTNIVPVFAFGEQDGICYYAMQYIAGHSLDTVLDDIRRLRREDEGPAATPDTLPHVEEDVRRPAVRNDRDEAGHRSTDALRRTATLGLLRQPPENKSVVIWFFCSTLFLGVSGSSAGSREGMMNVLTEQVIASFKDAARKLTGAKRRAFQAQVTFDYLGGNAWKAEKVFGWSHPTVTLGLNELRTGIICLGNFSARGNHKTEAKFPKLEADIRALAEPESQTDPKFQSPFLYTRLTAKAVRRALIDQKGWTDEELPHVNTIGEILNRLGYKLRRVQKTKPLKKIKETDAIFDNVRQENQAADNDPGAIRISMDAKAKVAVGDYSRDGESRGAEPTKGLDHDPEPEQKLVPQGILDVTSCLLSIFIATSNGTSDFFADCLEQWWEANKVRYPNAGRLVIDLDNGPENSSHRTQFMNRLVIFADATGLEIKLVYYPPYHSKYNPIEHCWGVLESHWNGTLLNSVATVVEWARTMTWKGTRPIVKLIETTYDKGVRIAKDAYRAIESRLQRHDSLPKYDVLIRPQPV